MCSRSPTGSAGRTTRTASPGRSRTSWPRSPPPPRLTGMFLENLVIDAVDPGRLGRFWQQALGTEQLTDAPEGFETRLHLAGDAYLDLCFPRVPDVPT